MRVAQNLSILFWIRKNASKSTVKKSPIYCRITINGERAEISTGINIEEENFNKATGLLKGKSRETIDNNEQLLEMRSKLRKIYNSLVEKEELVTANLLSQAFIGKVENQKTLVQAFNFHNEQFLQKVKAGQKAMGTYRRFNVTLNKLKAFIKKEFNTNDILLANIKGSFAEDFEHYLTTHDLMHSNTAMKHIKNTKKIMLLAVQKEWLVRNPLSQFRCTYQNPERARLMEDELEKLRTKEMPSKRLEEVRDCYVAMCYTGYAYKDAASLSPDNIQIMIDGNRWLIKNRVKTECKENVPILPVVAELINKYKNHLYCINYNKLFPIRSNQKFNDYLKEVAAICGINKNLTTHTARHTFATTVTLSNGVPIETVSALLGHSSIRTTQIYAKVVAQKVSNDMDILRQKLADKSSASAPIVKAI